MPKEKERKPEEQVKDDVSAMVAALGVSIKADDEKDKDKGKDKDKDKDKDIDKDKDKENDNEDTDDDASDDDNEDSDDDSNSDSDEEDDDDSNDDDTEDESDDEDEDTSDEDDENEDDDIDEPDDDELDLKTRLAIAEAERDAAVTKQEETKPTQDIKSVDFVGDDDVEELMNNKDALNKLLNTVRLDAYNLALRNLPSLTAGLVDKRQAIKNAVVKFYEDNPDLAKVKDYVSSIAQKTQNKYPLLDNDTLFKLTAKQVRKDLGMKPEKKKSKNLKKKRRDDNKEKPAMRKNNAGGGGKGRKQKDARTVFEKERDAMLNVS